MRGRRHRVVLIALAGVLAAALGLVLSWAGPLDRAEAATVDWRFDLRGGQGTPADVAVVAIDDPSTKELGQLPFPRSYHAQVIRRLARDGARVIAYDIQFSEPTTPFDGTDAAATAAEDEDFALQQAITAAKRVVLGTTGVFADGSPDILFDDKRLEEAQASVGNASFDVGPTATWRRLPYATDGLRSFAVVAAERASGEPADPAGFRDGGAWIDYAGPPGTVATYSFVDVLDGKVPASAFRGKVVVVGATAIRLNDVHPTSVGDGPMAGPEINANAIQTVMDGVPLRDSPGWLDAILIVGLAALAALAGLRRSAVQSVLPSVLLLAALLLGAYGLFLAGTVIPVVVPALALVVAALGVLAVNYATVERERSRLRTEFARFVPESVVGDVIAAAGDGARLGGRRLYATVLFCDLRGFTARAEGLPPEFVIELLNRYLTEMSDAVLDNGGTLVSFQGDGIMAVFGAPLEQQDHADRALAAAREILGVRLPAVNAWVQDRGLGDRFAMGIGICSGFVMSGNVGSDRRLEYATVGDTTNTAARLQSMTKDTPHAVLISDSTRAALTRQAPDLSPVGALDVRGRSVPAAVWTLSSPPVGGDSGAA
ncbi:MAG: CHASE2 domain-containing protein [Thermoleophilia bacterium]